MAAMRADAPHPEALIAVDGGGTGCRLVLWRQGIPATAESGPANLSSDFEGALRSIRAGLSTLSAHTGCNLAEVPAYLALAGAITPDLCRRAEAALPLTRVRVEEDRRAAVRGALGTEAGGVLHAGTGSFVAVQDARGTFRTAGGHGHVLGDDASAYAIARDALSAALDAADGTGPATDLTTTLLDRFGGAAGIIAFASEAPPEEIARLSTLVTEIDDAVSQRILREGARYFERILRSLRWRKGMALCLTGGAVWAYTAHLSSTLQDNLRLAQGNPLDGALSLAADFARERPA